MGAFKGLPGVPIIRYLFVLLSNLGGHNSGISVTLRYYITEKITLLSFYYQCTIFYSPKDPCRGPCRSQSPVTHLYPSPTLDANVWWVSIEIIKKKKEFCSFPPILSTFRTPESPIRGPLGPLGVQKARYPSVRLLLHLTGGPEMRFRTSERKKKNFILFFPWFDIYATDSPCLKQSRVAPRDI